METNNFETYTELMLYLFINTAGAFIWRMNHDMADGRIPEKDWSAIDEDIVRMRIDQKEAVRQTSRFGINPFSEGDKPSDEYLSWFKKWDNYINSLTDKECGDLQKRIDNNEDCSMYKPAD